MELKELPRGRHKAEEIVVGNKLGWAKVDGQWYALNHLSAHPERMRNRDQRRVFANTIGVTLKEVENYVRRKRREREKEYLAEELADASALLKKHGYSVSKGEPLT